MSNDKHSKDTHIQLIAVIFKYVKLHEDYRETFTTIKLYLCDIYKNVINMLKDGIAFTGIPHLCGSLLSLVKHCFSYCQEQGHSLLKLNTKHSIRKLTSLPVARHVSLPIRKQRRAA